MPKPLRLALDALDALGVLLVMLLYYWARDSVRDSLPGYRPPPPTKKPRGPGGRGE